MDKKYEKPSTYTILYWLIQDKKIKPHLLFDCLGLFWPTFIKKDKYVFLKESFLEEEYKRLTNENSNPEYWINLLTIDELFSTMSDWQEKSRVLAQTLTLIWTAKLTKDFPDMHFTVEYLQNEDSGDYGLTFYQSSRNRLQEKIDDPHEILTPNVKESRLEQSSRGPRPGMPKIRKPNPDELPK